MKRAFARWGGAVLAVVATTALNAGVQLLTGGRVPFLPYFPMLIVVTLLGGPGPAALALALSGVAVAWYWFGAAGALWPADAPEAWSLVLFIAAGATIIAVSDTARRLLARARHAREELARTRARLHAAHEAARMVEWEWDLGTGDVRLSPSARRVFGTSWSDAESAWPLGHPDDVGRVQATIRDALARGEDYAFTSRMLHAATGETRWIETRAVVHKDGTGAPSHVTGVTLDVTERQHALEAARVAEQRFRVALDGSGIVAWACDAALRYTWVYSPNTGLDAAAFLGRRVGSLFPREGAEAFVAAVERVHRTGTSERLPVTWTSAAGVTRHYYASIEAVRDAQGAITGLVGASVDVTALRRAEELARENEERFARAFRASPDGLTLSRLADGRLVEVNEAFLELTGLTREEAVGRHAMELGLYPDPTERMRGLEALLRTGSLRDFPLTVRRRDGTVRTVRVSAERLEIGGEPALLVITRDVTEQERVTDALRESEERLRLALDGGRIGMWATDLRTGLTECTPHNLRIFGLPEEHGPVTRETWEGLVHPDDHAVIAAAWEEAVQRDGRYVAEYRIVRPDGALRWLDTRAVLHRDADGRPARLVGITLDVTERREAEEALREADRRKDEFLATLAHELRNPLAPLRTAAHVLQSPALRDGARREAEAMIERQVAHMTRLVDDLLDISRLTLGRVELRRERTSLRLVLEQALEAACPELDAAGLALEVDVPEEPLGVEADVVRLAQVFTNLLSNAARYTPAGGRVAVTARAEGADAVVAVRDTGVGIAPAMLERVFEMFVQLPNAGHAGRGGLGIGLALARRLVELHGGTIEARSDGEGRGAEFRVRLPRAELPRAAARPAPRTAVEGRSRRVLVVDDNVDAAESLGMLLRLGGHEVRVVHSGEAALDALANGAAGTDVVLLDIGLPGLDGYEVARRIREVGGPAAPRLVALTGWGQESDRARSAAAGFDHHLLKPADPAAVAEVIDALAGGGAGPARREG